MHPHPKTRKCFPPTVAAVDWLPGCCRSMGCGGEAKNKNGGHIMFDIERLMKVMSEILSDRYGVKITMTATKKEEAA